MLVLVLVLINYSFEPSHDDNSYDNTTAAILSDVLFLQQTIHLTSITQPKSKRNLKESYLHH